MLANKNIVIVGGTTGIGLSAAKAFVAQGARVVVVGRTEATAEAAFEALGASAGILVADASHPDTAQQAIKLCHEKFGELSGMYHVAGGSGRKFGDGPLHEVTLDGWHQTFELNLTSLMLSNQAAIKAFRNNQSGGTILNMSSVLGFSPSPRFFSTHAYAAAKSAVFGLSRAAAAFYARDNIRVNVIAPALVKTPMSQRASEDEEIMSFVRTKQPLDGGRNGKPQDLDGLAIYFMSDQSRFTTGQVISVDGGWDISEGQYPEDDN